MEVNHRTAARIRSLPEMRTEARRRITPDRTRDRERDKRERKKEREGKRCPHGGRPLKKVMRIYFDGRGRERRVYARRSRNERSAAEKRADERAARAAFVNDECVVTRGGKLRGALEYERVAHAGLS